MADRSCIEVTGDLCYIIMSGSLCWAIAGYGDGAELKLFLTVNVSFKVPRASVT